MSFFVNGRKWITGLIKTDYEIKREKKNIKKDYLNSLKGMQFDFDPDIF